MKSEWSREIAKRVVLLWPIKAIGTSVFMALFFLAYFSILRSPNGISAVVPTIALDHWIAFTPAFYPVYVSLWIYVSLPPALMSNFRALLHYVLWIAALCLFGLTLFWFFPTQTPDFGLDWRLYPELASIKGIDAAGNACPSLHVATAVFSALWLDRLMSVISVPMRLRQFNLAYCLAIAWSTMATRQHVALDVLAGAIVGIVFAVFSLRATRSSIRPLPI